jgi:hypothetical protein
MKKIILLLAAALILGSIHAQESFRAKTVYAKIVELRWKVKFEDHIDRYVIEWSKDGVSYDSIASVDGAVWNPKPYMYKWYDDVSHIMSTDTHYYRIRTVWIDGGYAWCKPVMISCKRKKY